MCGCDRPTATLCTPKPTNITELKAALLSIWNDLAQEFTDNAILSFRKRFRFCLGRYFEHSPRGQLAFITETFEVLIKKLHLLLN